MDLNEYLFRYDITVRDLAKKIKYEESYVSKIKRRRTIPGKKMADAIVKATKGEVSHEDLMYSLASTNKKKSMIRKKQTTKKKK